MGITIKNCKASNCGTFLRTNGPVKIRSSGNTIDRCGTGYDLDSATVAKISDDNVTNTSIVYGVRPKAETPNSGIRTKNLFSRPIKYGIIFPFLVTIVGLTADVLGILQWANFK